MGLPTDWHARTNAHSTPATPDDNGVGSTQTHTRQHIVSRPEVSTASGLLNWRRRPPHRLIRRQRERLQKPLPPALPPLEQPCAQQRPPRGGQRPGVPRRGPFGTCGRRHGDSVDGAGDTHLNGGAAVSASGQPAAETFCDCGARDRGALTTKRTAPPWPQARRYHPNRSGACSATGFGDNAQRQRSRGPTHMAPIRTAVFVAAVAVSAARVTLSASAVSPSDRTCNFSSKGRYLASISAYAAMVQARRQLPPRPVGSGAMSRGRDRRSTGVGRCQQILVMFQPNFVKALAGQWPRAYVCTCVLTSHCSRATALVKQVRAPPQRLCHWWHRQQGLPVAHGAGSCQVPASAPDPA